MRERCGAEGGASRRRSGADGKRPPLRSFDTLMQQTNASRPGDPMTLLIERNDGSRGTVQFPLRSADHRRQAGISFKLILLTLQAIFPGFCLLVGLWVVAAKPRDPNAWYVLGILGYIQCFFGQFELLERAGPSLHVCLFCTWPASHSSSACCSSASTSRNGRVLTSDIHGPSGFSLPHHWLCAAWMFLSSWAVPSISRSLPGFHPGFTNWMTGPNMRLRSSASAFFSHRYFPKYFTASTRDAKRRLGVLVWGAEIGLTPMFIGVVIAQIRNTALYKEPFRPGISGPV